MSTPFSTTPFPSEPSPPGPSRHVPRRNGVTRLVDPEEAARLARAQRDQQPGLPRLSSSVLTGSLKVRLDARHRPVRLERQGRWYRVVAPPLHWFERRRWWVEETRAERGRPGLVDYEIWRVQVLAQDDPRAAVRTVDITCDPQSQRWRVVRVHQLAA